MCVFLRELGFFLSLSKGGEERESVMGPDPHTAFCGIPWGVSL